MNEQESMFAIAHVYGPEPDPQIRDEAGDWQCARLFGIGCQVVIIRKPEWVKDDEGKGHWLLIAEGR